MELLTFRDSIFKNLPRWLKGFWGARFIYSMILVADAFGEAAKQALTSRFPGFNPTAIPQLCRDRDVLRGPNETDDQIVARLLLWLDSKRLLGHPLGQMQQVAAYCTPFPLHMRVVFNGGRYWDWNSGTVTIGSMAWNWDGLNLPARFWLIIYEPPFWTDDGVFGSAGGRCGDGGTWGIGPIGDALTGTVYGTVQGIASLIRSQGSGNIRHMHTIVVWNETTWNAQQPDGTWNVMSHRNPHAAYLAGDRVYQ